MICNGLQWFGAQALAGLLVLALCCDRDPRLAVVPEGSGQTELSPIVETESPDLEARGAVLTVLTAVGVGAPAATRDRVALLRVTLTSGGFSDQLDVPIGGAGILVLSETAADGSLSVEVLSPDRRIVGYNALDLQGLVGSVSIVALEVTSRSPVAGCDRCSPPEALTEIRGLLDTLVYWSAASGVATGASDETLLVATRARASAVERRALFEAAGGNVVEAHLDEAGDLLWTRLRPADTQTVVDLAVSLARRAMVKGLVLDEGEGWPRLLQGGN